jgi:phosphoribosylformylglycinamidine synthase subunit PurQ / glutaminase
LKVAVIQFPGSNCDRDTVHVLKDVIKLDAELVWHNEFKDGQYDAAVLPGGFSFGDHLRGGTIAAHSPATKAVTEMAREDKPVLGICNGFQILIEAGLLPGALLRNTSLKFICKWMTLRIESDETAFTSSLKKDLKIRMPIAHNEGRFYVDENVLDRLEAESQVVMKYVDENPTGTSRAIAAISNERGNVVGMMPHPERASEHELGGTDGRRVFESMVEWARC